MKRMVVSAFLVAGLSSNALAVGVAPTVTNMGSALEILKLPSENRRIALMGKGKDLYPQFVNLAFNEEQPMSVRWRALMAVAEAQGVRATDDLLRAGDHKHWYMRNAALVALAEINPSQAEKLAKKLLKDKALVVRSAAVEALEKNSTPEVRDLLWEELNQSYNFKNTQSLWVRSKIVAVLAQKPLDHEMKLFAQLLSDKDARVQLPAVRGLEKLTGVSLGEGTMKSSALVGLWKNYLKKEKIEL